MRTTTTFDCPNCGDLLSLKDFVPNRGAICPRCGMTIDLAALQQALQAAAAPPKAPPADEAPPSDEPAEEEIAEAPPEAEPEPPEQPAAAAPTTAAALADEEQEPRVSVWLAFAAGGLAVLVAWISPVAFLSKWLSLAGLILAVWLAIAQVKTGKVHYPLAAGALCFLTLLVVGRWWRRAPLPPPPAMVVIPHDESGLLPSRGLQEGEWVDAADNDVRRQDVRLRIVSATVGTVELRRGEERPIASKTKHLILKLLVSLEGERARSLPYEPWANTKQSPSKHPATLTDNKDQSYPQDTFDPLKVPGRGEKIVSVVGAQIREVLVYPAAAAEAESLRLELPASAYGLEGTFRFEIPHRMIQVAQGPPATGGR
jgi:hypothetical protein